MYRDDMVRRLLWLLLVSAACSHSGSMEHGANTSSEGAGSESRAKGNARAEQDAPVGFAVRWIGRVDLRDPNAPRFSWSHSGFAVRFVGRELRVTMNNEDEYTFRGLIDGAEIPPFRVELGESQYRVVRDLAPGEHTLTVIRETEGQYGASTLVALKADKILPPPPPAPRRIEVIGDSVAAGYGVLGEEHHKPERRDGCGYNYATQSAFYAFPGITARKLNADLSLIAHSGWGVYRDTKHQTDGAVPLLYDRIIGDRTIPIESWGQGAHVVVIELGTNDFAGPPDSDPGAENFVPAYSQLLERARMRNPNAWIFCVVGPLLSDASRPDVRAHSAHREYVRRAIAKRVAGGDDRIALVEFPRVDFAVTGCNWQPNAGEHAKMADVLSKEIRAHLGW
jgi:lysophospholipase L1-like esterase